MANITRIRFAPSPTGEPHIGNIRTALFAWLLTRHNNDKFILRIEDTDQARTVPGAVEKIIESLKWLGIDWDEGPYHQSERLELYRSQVQLLIDKGAAYNFEDERGAAVKFTMPKDGSIKVKDSIRGEVTFDNSLIDDFIIMKSDGFPTYHLASVVDDHLMGISQVIRAEEWLPSLPRHICLYRAFDWEPPEFAHLPVILASDRSKLSKRHGATALLEYQEMGYLPHALLNFLSLLGWSLDDKSELFTVEDLVKLFTLERVSKSAAIFNPDKLDWMNGHYIRQMRPEELADTLLDHWHKYPPPEINVQPDRELLIRIVPLVQERLKTLSDAAPLIPFFFTTDFDYEATELVQKKMDMEQTRLILNVSKNKLQNIDEFKATELDSVLRTLAEDIDVKIGQLLGTLRVATSGLKVSPPIFESMEILGKDRILSDIDRAIKKLDSIPKNI